MKYICVAPSCEILDITGNKIDETGMRALYYEKTLHRKRIYRSGFPCPFNPNFTLFSYKDKKRAQSLCDYTNIMLKENFQVVEDDLSIENIEKQLKI